MISYSFFPPMTIHPNLEIEHSVQEKAHGWLGKLEMTSLLQIMVKCGE